MELSCCSAMDRLFLRSNRPQFLCPLPVPIDPEQRSLRLGPRPQRSIPSAPGRSPPGKAQGPFRFPRLPSTAGCNDAPTNVVPLSSLEQQRECERAAVQCVATITFRRSRCRIGRPMLASSCFSAFLRTARRRTQTRKIHKVTRLSWKPPLAMPCGRWNLHTAGWRRGKKHRRTRTDDGRSRFASGVRSFQMEGQLRQNTSSGWIADRWTLFMKTKALRSRVRATERNRESSGVGRLTR